MHGWAPGAAHKYALIEWHKLAGHCVLSGASKALHACMRAFVSTLTLLLLLCCHRVAVDLGMEPGWPAVDKAYNGVLNFVRDRS